MQKNSPLGRLFVHTLLLINQALSRVLCHNLCCLIQSMCELESSQNLGGGSMRNTKREERALKKQRVFLRMRAPR